MVTLGSKKTLRTRERPRSISVRKRVCADSSRTPARSLGAALWAREYSLAERARASATLRSAIDKDGKREQLSFVRTERGGGLLH